MTGERGIDDLHDAAEWVLRDRPRTLRLIRLFYNIHVSLLTWLISGRRA